MDDFFVKTGSRLFVGNQLPNAVTQIRADIERRIAATGDDALLEADADAWAEALAEELRLDPPTIDVDRSTLHPGDRVNVSCTNAPGISYTASEWGHVIREGYEFELRVPVARDSYLLGTHIFGAPELPGGICGPSSASGSGRKSRAAPHSNRKSPRSKTSSISERPRRGDHAERRASTSGQRARCYPDAPD